MTISVEEFLTFHPQFVDCSPAAISQALVEAATMVSQEHFGDLYELAVRLNAAHILAIEMYGQQASIKGGETTQYEIKFKQLVRLKGPRGNVT